MEKGSSVIAEVVLPSAWWWWIRAWRKRARARRPLDGMAANRRLDQVANQIIHTRTHTHTHTLSFFGEKKTTEKSLFVAFFFAGGRCHTKKKNKMGGGVGGVGGQDGRALYSFRGEINPIGYEAWLCCWACVLAEALDYTADTD